MESWRRTCSILVDRSLFFSSALDPPDSVQFSSIWNLQFLSSLRPQSNCLSISGRTCPSSCRLIPRTWNSPYIFFSLLSLPLITKLCFLRYNEPIVCSTLFFIIVMIAGFLKIITLVQYICALRPKLSFSELSLSYSCFVLFLLSSRVFPSFDASRLLRVSGIRIHLPSLMALGGKTIYWMSKSWRAHIECAARGMNPWLWRLSLSARTVWFWLFFFFFLLKPFYPSIPTYSFLVCICTEEKWRERERTPPRIQKLIMRLYFFPSSHIGSNLRRHLIRLPYTSLSDCNCK